jgi:hypothetical protein
VLLSCRISSVAASRWTTVRVAVKANSLPGAYGALVGALWAAVGLSTGL